jgi:hypothetical protein
MFSGPIKTLLTSTCASLIVLSAAAQTTTLNFEDIAPGTLLSGTTYGGIFWEQGSPGESGNIGGWKAGGDYPHSGSINLLNYWGCPLLGMTFPSAVNVESAYFAGQGVATSFTPELRVHGYLGGVEVATTDWFNQISSTPVLFNINLSGVDRIVIESVPVIRGGGWFGMDDFTYSVPEPTTAALIVLGIGGAALRCRRYGHTAIRTH